jgi:hypothetical protein
MGSLVSTQHDFFTLNHEIFFFLESKKKKCGFGGTNYPVPATNKVQRYLQMYLLRLSDVSTVSTDGG